MLAACQGPFSFLSHHIDHIVSPHLVQTPELPAPPPTPITNPYYARHICVGTASLPTPHANKRSVRVKIGAVLARRLQPPSLIWDFYPFLFFCHFPTQHNDSSKVDNY